MDKLFLTILNMSLTGAFVITAILLARLLLKNAPKIICYYLWAVAGFRLVFPFSIESVFSLIPFKSQTIPLDIATHPVPHINSGITFVNSIISSSLPAPMLGESITPLQAWTNTGAFVWFMGAAVMFIYGIVSYVMLKYKMRESICMESHIYEAENIKSPFVLGVFAPRIFIPIGLYSQEREYIILHEQTHIRRHDHIVKLTAYFVLCLHWFNPLVWIAFMHMGMDMEMSCDECVLKKMGEGTKKDYSLLLLSLATDRHIIGGSPIAFGEGGADKRIKNVLNFRKPSWVTIAAAVVLVAVLSVGLTLNRGSNSNQIEDVTTDSHDVFKADEAEASTKWLITLDDLRKLASKGNSLLFEDLQEFQGGNVSSSLSSYIMVYSVEGGYRLVVSSKPSGQPDSVILESIWESGGSGIDIRYKDVDAFLLANPSQAAITEEQAQDIAQTTLEMDMEPVSWYILGELSEQMNSDAVFAQALLDSVGLLNEPCWVLRVKGTPEWGGQYYAVGKKSGTIFICRFVDNKLVWDRIAKVS